MSGETARALGTVGWWLTWTLIVVGGPCLVKRSVQRRRAARMWMRVRHLDSPAARDARHERAVQGLNEGLNNLRAALIPAQGTGGER